MSFTAAVVSGASRGLGAHICAHLAAAGHPVCVNYHADEAGAAGIVDRIAAGGAAVAVRADATDGSAVRRLIETATSELGPVGVLVANATEPQPDVAVTDVTWQQHLDQLRYFVGSPTLLVQAALPGMRRLRSGRVVLIGPDSAVRAPVGQSAYVAAKTAQVGLTKVWAEELAVDGITVNLVQPGWVPVERHAGENFSGYLSEVPLQRMGRRRRPGASRSRPRPALEDRPATRPSGPAAHPASATRRRGLTPGLGGDGPAG